MNSRDDQQLRAQIEEIERRGMIDKWEEDNDYIIFYVGSLTYGVRRDRAGEFLNGLETLHDRVRDYLSPGQCKNDN